MMKAALYLRVSTREQADDGYSLRSQRQRLEAFAFSQGWDIYDFYQEDGESGRNTNRPELQRMIADIEAQKIDVVVVFRLDRFSRNVRDLNEMLHHFDQHGCMFRSATEPYDTTTANGRLFLNIVGSMAQWESDTISERVSLGMGRMVQEGKWHGGTPPYGYIYNGEKLDINPEEARVVRDIYDMYLQGIGASRICERLNRSGEKPRKAKVWDVSFVHQILKNPAYIGAFRYQGETHSLAPRILDDDTFLNAQNLREGRAGVHPRRVSGRYIFSGVIRCARCGSHMNGKHTSSRGNAYDLYACHGRTNGVCDMPLVNEKYVEEQFVAELENAASTMEKQTTEVMNEDVQQSENERLRKELDTIKKRRRKWQEAFANEVITLEELRDLTTADSERMEEIEDALNQKEETGKVTEADLRQLQKSWHPLEREEKKTVVAMMVDEIRVNAENGVMGRGRKRKVWLADISFL